MCDKIINQRTGVELRPGKPDECEGKDPRFEFCYDECDYFLECFPEWSIKTDSKIGKSKYISPNELNTCGPISDDPTGDFLKKCYPEAMLGKGNTMHDIELLKALDWFASLPRKRARGRSQDAIDFAAMNLLGFIAGNPEVAAEARQLAEDLFTDVLGSTREGNAESCCATWCSFVIEHSDRALLDEIIHLNPEKREEWTDIWSQHHPAIEAKEGEGT